MATRLLTENIYGCYNADISVNVSNFSDVKFRVLKNLQVIFQYVGKRDDFVVSRSTCALARALAKHPSLFHNLSKACKPIDKNRGVLTGMIKCLSIKKLIACILRE